MVAAHFHMDSEYAWRWYITDATGNSLAMSATAYFSLAEAVRALDAFRTILISY